MFVGRGHGLSEVFEIIAEETHPIVERREVMKKIQLPKSLKSKIKVARAKVFEEMSKEGISQDEWGKLSEKYKMYTSMLSGTALKFTPDTVLIAATNILGIVLILNFEKLDIVRSKALGFILKGRV